MAGNYFVGIGAQKAGTSWLARFMEKQPGIYLSPLKEMHYFDDKHVPMCDFQSTFRKRFLKRLEEQELNPPGPLIGRKTSGEWEDRFKRDMKHLFLRCAMAKDQDYAEYFQDNLPGGTLAFGELSPSYGMLPEEGFQNILEIYPDARFIFILRNPASRLWSQITFHHKRLGNYEPVENLDNALHDELFLSRSDYAGTLERLTTVVPPENIHLLFYEELFAKESRTERVREILEFIGIHGVEPTEEDFQKRYKTFKKAPMPPEHRAKAVKALRSAYEAGGKYLGYLPESWQQDLSTI